MQRFTKSEKGVTLLEVMLVLSIGAMLTVMSIRYYQSANSSQQANAVVQQIAGILTAAEQLAQTTGSYANSVDGKSITEQSLQPLLPTNAFTTPWGGSITIPAVSSSSFQIKISTIPTSVCTLVRAKLATNTHYSKNSSRYEALEPCSSMNRDWSFYYVANV